MEGLRIKLLQEQQRLERIAQETQERLQNSPAGSLRLSRSRGNVQYYHIDKNSKTKKGSYISKCDTQLIGALAQKDYDERLLRHLDKRIQQFKHLTKDYFDEELENLYYHESEERRKYINPAEEPWDEFQKRWVETPYEGKNFREGEAVITTDCGERVRSKSEKILADYFHRHGISYKYEKPLLLKGHGVVYPDFTLLSKKTRREIYWEHLGMMDDEKYVNKAIRKIRNYEENGIYVGDRLILTYETKGTVLNSSDIERNIRRFISQ